MRVVFEIPPATASFDDPKDGIVGGTARFSAVLYDPGEQVPMAPSGEPSARLMSYWRQSLPRGQPLRVPPGRRLIGFPDVVIPPEILDILPDTASLELVWNFTRSGVKR
jgi:hypothetical protein